MGRSAVWGNGMSDELVTVARFLMPSTAHEARIELERQGVEGASVDEHAVSRLFPGADGMATVSLQVRACDAERAIAILSQTPAAKSLVVEIEPEQDEEPTEPS